MCSSSAFTSRATNSLCASLARLSTVAGLGLSVGPATVEWPALSHALGTVPTGVVPVVVDAVQRVQKRGTRAHLLEEGYEASSLLLSPPPTANRNSSSSIVIPAYVSLVETPANHGGVGSVLGSSPFTMLVGGSFDFTAAALSALVQVQRGKQFDRSTRAETSPKWLPFRANVLQDREIPKRFSYPIAIPGLSIGQFSGNLPLEASTGSFQVLG